MFFFCRALAFSYYTRFSRHVGKYGGYRFRRHVGQAVNAVPGL